MALDARVLAQAIGYPSGGEIIGAPPRNAGPNLGLPHATYGEAYMRPYPQVTEELA
jgi:hypothetical protein